MPICVTFYVEWGVFYCLIIDRLVETCKGYNPDCIGSVVVQVGDEGEDPVP